MNQPGHIVVFDGTSHFIESADYEIGEDEKIVGRFYKISDAALSAEKLNELMNNPKQQQR